MRLEDRKKIVVWLKKEIAKIKAGPQWEKPEVKAKVAKLEQSVVDQERTIATEEAIHESGNYYKGGRDSSALDPAGDK